jgi:hypothetical protein
MEDRTASASYTTKEIVMRKLVLTCGLGLLGGCVAPPDDRAGDPPELETSTATAASFSYFPMGFTHVTAGGGTGPTFNSTGGGVTVTHSPPGNYQVTFAGLGAPSLTDATGGNVQVTAEGTTNVRCRIVRWNGSPDVTATVQCAQPNGTLADSGFVVLFFRYAMPAPNTFPINMAYSWVTAAGAVSPLWDYNATGSHNTVTRTPPGRYALHIPNMTAANASMMVSTYGSDGGAGAVCSVVSWGAGPVGGAGVVNIQCRNVNNVLVDNAFSFSYSTSGPTLDQQGAHAWFDGSSASPSYSEVLGKIESCSAASVTGSGGPVVTITVSGDLGSWDASPFLRASFSSGYGVAGYCNVESLTTVGVAPSSTSTTKLRCYDPTGAVVAVPQLTFTHVTSDAAGPC